MNLICFILGQVRQEDPENVLVSSLAYLTRTKALYGGDLEAVVTIMRTVASRIQYRLQSSSNFHDKVCKKVDFTLHNNDSNKFQGGSRLGFRRITNYKSCGIDI